jgi:hypothetical protein
MRSSYEYGLQKIIANRRVELAYDTCWYDRTVLKNTKVVLPGIIVRIGNWSWCAVTTPLFFGARARKRTPTRMCPGTTHGLVEYPGKSCENVRRFST